MARIVLVLSLLISGCTGPVHQSSAGLPDAPSSATPGGAAAATVSAGGVRLTMGSLTVSAPTGVAPEGAVLRYRTDSTPPDGVDPANVLAGFDLGFDGGQQPAASVTVTLSAAAIPAGHAVAFIMSGQESGTWEGRPVTLGEAGATVTMPHFTSGWFLDVQGLLSDIGRTVTNFLGQTYDPPSCYGRTARLGGREYSVTASQRSVYPCVAAAGDKISVKLYSNSPYVWIVRPDGQGKGVKPVPPNTLSGVITAAAYDATRNYDFERQTTLIAGGHAEVLFPSTVTSAQVGAQADAAWALVQVLIAALDQMATMSGVSLTSLDRAKAGECIAGLIESGIDPTRDVGTTASTVLTCVGTGLTGVASVFLGIVTSLTSLLITQLRGVVDTFTGADKVLIQLTSKPLAPAPTPTSSGSSSSIPARYTPGFQVGRYTCGTVPDAPLVPVKIASGTITCADAMTVAQRYIKESLAQSARGVGFDGWACGMNPGPGQDMAHSNMACHRGDDALTIGEGQS